jgi:hypothetical protein
VEGSVSDQALAWVFEEATTPPQNLEDALNRPIQPITDKQHLAPSGNPHDYVSLSIYWWPNPITSLPWLPHDGQRNPLANEYDAPRLRQFIRTVRTLASAAKPAADSRAMEWLRAWLVNPTTRMNPHLTFAQMMPGLAAGGRQGIIEGLPIATDLLDALSWLESRSAISQDDHREIRRWLGQYLAWLLHSSQGRAESSRTNNHGTWYDVQITALTHSLGLAALERQTLQRSRTRLAAQFSLDGSQPEEMRRAKSFDYSLYNLNAWLHLDKLAKRHGMSFWNEGPAQGVNFLRQNAATWPKHRVSGDPMKMLKASPVAQSLR